jgi:hypothetical protein
VARQLARPAVTRESATFLDFPLNFERKLYYFRG